MGNLNDYNLVKQKSIDYSKRLSVKSSLSDNQKARYGFYLLVLECVTGELDTDILTDMIIDSEFCDDILKSGNDDLGIDAYYIDHDAHEIKLFNFKYRENFNPTNSTKESDVYDSTRFFSVLDDENTSLIKKSVRTKEAVDTILECLDSSNDYNIRLYMVANVNGKLSQSPGLIAFRDRFNLKVCSVVLDDISRFISGEPQNKSATLRVDKNAVLTYGCKADSSENSYLVRVSLANLVRITCSNDNLRNNSSITDYSVLEHEELELDLLYENVRGYLGNTEYNKNIVNTIINNPSNFFLYNNGITIVTDKLKYTPVNARKKYNLFMDGFQIVNGGQTLRSVYKFCQTNFDTDKLIKSEVLLRILKVDSDDLKNNIAEYTNSQNAITDSDLKSVTLMQRQLEAYLKLKKINYLRKVGDYKFMDDADFTISMMKTAQIIFSYNGNPHKAGNQRKSLFTKFYNDIFPETLEPEFVEKLIRLFFRITELYISLGYSTYDQKVFYVLYMLSYCEEDIITDDYLRSTIEQLETTIKNFEIGSTLSEARKILKTDFKKTLDMELKAN